MEIKKYDEHTKTISEDIEKVLKKKNTKLPIILISLFLIIFLSALVFEFYHIVNNATPSVSLLEKETTTKESPSNIEKIFQYFSKEKLFGWFDSETQEDRDIAEEQEENEEQAEQEGQEDQEDQDIDNLPPAANDTMKKESFQNTLQNTDKQEYSLQLMAVREVNLPRLKEIAKILIDEDYYAYIYKTPNKIKNSLNSEGDYYFRLRIGFFEDKQKATKVAYKLIKKYPKIFKNYFIALPLKEEYQADFFVFSPEKQ